MGLNINLTEECLRQASVIKLAPVDKVLIEPTAGNVRVDWN